eukprot:gb/GECG01008862.1/.p1 GENE.gb/GECG01008862.1/~~gb/GECG01008862.1/.p1  ORF type:complete len:103 (+),score=3.54 gb/GECG01008862.1/:1-309(+)
MQPSRPSKERKGRRPLVAVSSNYASSCSLFTAPNKYFRYNVLATLYYLLTIRDNTLVMRLCRAQEEYVASVAESRELAKISQKLQLLLPQGYSEAHQEMSDF